MNRFWRSCLLTGCLLTVGILAGAGPLAAQENPARIAAIMRDMEARGSASSTMNTPLVASSNDPMVTPPVIQVAALQPAVQSVMVEQAVGIPDYLLPEIYPPYQSQTSSSAATLGELQQMPLGERFMFSSAYQRRINPPRGSFANVPDDCGCCDEWATFMPCESCCRDLGLNPWVIDRARPNCPPDWWTHPQRSGQCGSCQSGDCGGASTRPHGWSKHSNW